MSILGREMKIPTTFEQEHAALRGCISWYIVLCSPEITPQHRIHSDHSYLLSLWLCSDRVCPHATDFFLRVTLCITLIS